MARKTKRETFKCRFPGCTHLPFDRSPSRGSHEYRAHGMRGGVVSAPAQPAKTEGAPAQQRRTVPAPILQPKASRYEQPQIHLQRAIEQLDAREAKIKAEIAKLEELRSEAEVIAKEKEVLSDALAKLAGAAKSQPRAKSAA